MVPQSIHYLAVRNQKILITPSHMHPALYAQERDIWRHHVHKMPVKVFIPTEEAVNYATKQHTWLEIAQCVNKVKIDFI